MSNQNLPNSQPETASETFSNSTESAPVNQPNQHANSLGYWIELFKQLFSGEYRNIILAIIVLLVLVFVGILTYSVYKPKDKSKDYPKVSTVEQKLVRIDFEKLELALKPEEHRRGLMFRDSICDRCGMLFVFPEEKELSFWMLNVNFPLDLIFMDSSGKIVKIYENTTPNNADKKYVSESPAQFVLEVKAGFVLANNLQEGQVVDIQYLQNQGVNFVWFNLAK
jgi:hypothetical protein